jgi:hypothetical protein
VINGTTNESEFMDKMISDVMGIVGIEPVMVD